MTESVQIDLVLNQKGASASSARVRDHEIVMDRPESKGGENKGPMGGEVLLMSLGGCFMSNLLAAAQARDMALDGVQLHVSGTLEGAPVRFSTISMQVRVPDRFAEKIQKLVTIAERACIVANTLKPAVNLTIQASD